MLHENEFIIRGHHLPTFWRVSATGEPPQETAKAVTEAVIFNNMQDWDYIEDVLLPHDSKKFEQKVAEVLEKFVGLPDEHPVRIVYAKIKDGICESCIIGAHCLKTGKWAAKTEPPKPNRDARFVEEFTRAVDWLNTNGNETLSTPIVTDSGIVTTAGVVKRVFSLVDYTKLHRTIMSDSYSSSSQYPL